MCKMHSNTHAVRGIPTLKDVEHQFYKKIFQDKGLKVICGNKCGHRINRINCKEHMLAIGNEH